MQFYPVLLLTGARQTGKTSLYQHLFPEYEYVSLDDPFEADRAEQMPKEFLESYPTPLIIDEVQYAPSLFRYLKLVVDERKRQGDTGCHYLLTGSQNFALMQNVSESLAGRAGVLSLSTLTADEVKVAQGSSFRLTDFIVKGGYPALYNQANLTPRTWFPSYISTYLERDVRNTTNVQNLRDFSRFIRALAIRTSQVLSFADIARDVGVAPNTIKSWLSIVQSSNLIYLLEPYYHNIGKRLIKAPKIYFSDTGLLLHLLGIDSWEAVTRSPLSGAIWENYCFTQLHKAFLNQGNASLPLWYWRTHDGNEVDFVIEQGSKLIALEAKFRERATTKDLKGFHHLQRYYGEDRIGGRIILCQTKGRSKLDGEIVVDNGLEIEDLIP